MDEFFTRATIVKERVDRLCAEGRRLAVEPTHMDLERLDAINAEVELCVRSLEEIREEQLVAMLPQAKAAKRRWWIRWLR